MAYSRNFDGESTASAGNYSAGDLNASTTLDVQSTVAFGGSGKALKLHSNNVNIGHDWAYDSATSFSSGDFTATFVARMGLVNNGSSGRVGCMFRVDSAANNGYSVHLRPQAATATVRLSRFAAATETVITTATFDAAATFVADTWYHVKVYMSGSTIRVRVWKDGDAEPGTWLIDTTDATYDNTRVKTGVYIFNSLTSSDLPVYIDSIIEEGGGSSYSNTSSETITLTETNTRSVARTVSEAISLTIALANISMRTLSEALSITESLVHSMARTLAEAISLTESLVRSLIRTITETAISVTDVLVKAPLRYISESVSISEQLTSLKVILSIFSETIDITESFVRAIVKNVSEAVSVADTFLKASIRNISETLSVTESRIFSVARTVADSISITEYISRMYAKTVTEALSLIEVIQKSILRSIIESFSLTEYLTSTLTVVSNIYKKLRGAVSMSDKIIGNSKTSSIKGSIRKSN